MDVPGVAEVKRLEIRPGDRLVVRLAGTGGFVTASW
jgi:hypothetical protein